MVEENARQEVLRTFLASAAEKDLESIIGMLAEDVRWQLSSECAGMGPTTAAGRRLKHMAM